MLSSRNTRHKSSEYKESIRLAAALPIAIVVVVGMETFVAFSNLDVGAGGVFLIAALATWSAYKYLAVPIAYILCAAGIALVPERIPWNYVRRVGQMIAAVAAVVAMYRILAIYEPFRGFLPVVLGYSIAAIGLAACSLFRRRLSVSRHIAAAAVLVVCGVALHIANYMIYFGLYSTLHLAIIQAELLVICFGVDGLLRLASTDRAPIAAGSIALFAVAIAGIAGASASGNGGDVESVFEDSTVIGQSGTVFADFHEQRSARRLSDADGASRFSKSSGMPDLPDGFALEDYDILLIASEATRYDKTTIGDPKTPSTPNIAKRARSAFSFRNAYSSSSGTMHALAGIFTMAYPSMIAMETWMKVWMGRLYDQEETIAESLRGAGYDTFWLGYNTWFPTSIFGFDQGFASVELIHGDADVTIADRAIAELQKRARDPRRFFGFLFFVSPHAPYLNRGYSDLPSKTDAERYLQELRNVDTQVERVLAALERTDRFQKMIVIFLGDHGEEFKEHGGTRHKTTVYCESTHVPLVVWVPGTKPKSIDKTTSTAYVFPWLFSHARSPALRKRFKDRAKYVFGPMLKETGGAVVVELVGHDRMRTSLVYDDLKINFDLISKRTQAFRLRSDPGEKRNLFASDPAVKSRAARAVQAYKKVRQAGARYVLKPKKKPPKIVQED